MSNNSFFKIKKSTFGTYTFIIFMLLLISSSIAAGLSSKIYYTINCESNIYHFSTSSNIFRYYKITYTEQNNSFCGTDESINGTSSIITVFNSTGNIILDNQMSGGGTVYCYTTEMSVLVSQTHDSYVFTVKIEIYYYKISSSILVTTAVMTGIYFIGLLFINWNKRDESIPVIGHHTKPETRITPKMPKYYYTIPESVPDDVICIISRTEITPDDRVYQCPECLSYFIAEYLMDWLESKTNCPVCRMKMKK